MLDEGNAQGLWHQIDAGRRQSLHIVYVARNAEADGIDLTELYEWGLRTGYWVLYQVPTLGEGINLASDAPADLIIILNGWVEEATEVAQAHPDLPIAIANPGGFSRFEFSLFPRQVVSAQWAAPRPGEFMDAVADALAEWERRRGTL